MIRRFCFVTGTAIALAFMASVSDAQQPREGRQNRRASPGQTEPNLTTLFEQVDVPYFVHYVESKTTKACIILMADKESKTLFGVQTNALDSTFVIVEKSVDSLPSPLTKADATLPLRVEVEGVAQRYYAKTSAPRNGRVWAEVFVPRPALHHLQAAVNSRGGVSVKAGDGAPIQFSVPPQAADAFHECGHSILRGRLDGALDSLNRSLNSNPTR